VSPRDDLHLDPELIALLALGETPGPPDEIAAARAHLASCGHCAAEVDELSAIARQARQVTPADALVSPPPAVWDAIAAETGVRATGSEPTTAETVVALRRHRTSWVQLAAAACVGLVVGGGAVLAATSGSRAPAAGVTPSVLAAASLAPLEGSTARGKVEVVSTSSGPRVLVDVTGLAKPDGFYEVWLLDRKGDRLVALGALDGTSQGSFAMPPGVAMSDFPVVDVSLEPSDGDPGHSHHSLVRGTLPA
jgi:anti-sigma factor RsiW